MQQLGGSAQAVMAEIARQLQARGFDDPWREIEPGALGDAREELVRAGLVTPKEGSATGFRLTNEGYSWVFESLHLVAAMCPKCSTPVALPQGLPSVPARCPTCFVCWTEDTR